MVACAGHYSTRKVETEGARGSLATQPVLLGKLQDNQRSYLRKQSDSTWGNTMAVELWFPNTLTKYTNKETVKGRLTLNKNQAMPNGNQTSKLDVSLFPGNSLSQLPLSRFWQQRASSQSNLAFQREVTVT